MAQAELEQLTQAELNDKLEAIFNELAFKKQALEECHCMLSMVRNAMNKQRFLL